MDKKFIRSVLFGEGIEEKWLLTGEGPKYKHMTSVPDITKQQEENKETAPVTAVKMEKQQPVSAGCQRCLELYDKLVQAQEKLVQAQEREVNLTTENVKLIIENAALKVVEKELRAELSLSASATGESTRPSAA